jgi:leucyl/phenylalanyl-tRNA--protein transferase
MFSLRADASKVAFVHLAKKLQEWGFPLIDCQVSNPHLLSLGAEEIDRQRFIDIVDKHIALAGPENWSMVD